MTLRCTLSASSEPPILFGNFSPFISFLNSDILSFYKEELAGETENYIKARAIATGKTAQQTLYDVVDETVATARRIREALGEGKVRDVWDGFEAGFVSFHIENPRYRLKEILDSN